MRFRGWHWESGNEICPSTGIGHWLGGAARAADGRPGGCRDPVAHPEDQRLHRLHQPSLGTLGTHSRARYFSWAGKNGPTGKERIIYGTYTIYDTSDCRKNVDKANALEPRDAELEAAASAYVEAVVALEPLLKEANDYYDQENYKDDKMAKGKALHPRLVAAWNAFATADPKLRTGIDVLQDKRAVERLAEIESTDGRKERYHVEALMISAKRVMRTETAATPNIAQITEAVADYESIVKATDEYAGANKDSKIGSSFVGTAKSFLTTAKQLMRRVRDKVPYSSGDRMMLNSGGGAWMVEGSPAPPHARLQSAGRELQSRREASDGGAGA